MSQSEKKGSSAGISRRRLLAGGAAVVVIGGVAYYLTQTGVAPPEEKTWISIRYSNHEAYRTLDPAIYSTNEAVLMVNAYDTLFFDETVNGLSTPVKHLVESYTVTPDGKQYTFTLRKGVKFHDGTELTAEDVAFTMDRILQMKTGYFGLWSGLVDVGSTQYPDKYTAVANLNYPAAFFIATLTRLHIMNKKLLLANKVSGDYGEFGDYGQAWIGEGNDAGSGAYRLTEFENKVKLVLTRNEDYFLGWPNPNPIDEFADVFHPEEATGKVAFLKKEADWLDEKRATETYDEVAKTSGVVVKKDPWNTVYYYTMNNTKPPYDDIHVRKAIAYALDKDKINTSLFGEAPPAEGFIPSGLWGHNPEVNISRDYAYNMDKARDELSQSKYSPQELKNLKIVEALSAGSALHVKAGALYQETLAGIGLTVELEPVEWVRFTQLCGTAETSPHTFFWYNTQKYPDPDAFTYMLFHPSVHPYYMGMMFYHTDELTSMLESSRKETDFDKRTQLFNRIEKYLSDNLPCVPMCEKYNQQAWWDYLKGYRMTHNLEYDMWLWPVYVDLAGYQAAHPS